MDIRRKRPEETYYQYWSSFSSEILRWYAKHGDTYDKMIARAVLDDREPDTRTPEEKRKEDEDLRAEADMEWRAEMHANEVEMEPEGPGGLYFTD